jgi:hypothetical protein
MTWKARLLLLGFVLMTRLAVAATPLQSQFAPARWSVNDPHNLAKHPPAKKAVWLFINKLGDPSINVSDLTPGNGELCSFRFVNLRHSGKLSLVAVYDGGGTAGCNNLTIFDMTSAGIESYDYSGALGSDDAKVAKDINGDGHFEIVPYDRLTPLGENLDWTDEWPSVYAWTGNGYTNVSSHYPRYYRTWLVSLKKEIVKLERERAYVAHEAEAEIAHNRVVIEKNVVVTNNFFVQKEPEVAQSVSPQVEAAPRIDIDCLLAQAGKIERFLGSSNAGLLDAIRWAHSKYPEERKLAAQVFADINTPEALKYEQTLSRDTDPEVANLASAKVKYWNEQTPYEAAIFERSTPEDPAPR